VESRRTCARTREARLRHQIDALQGQLADREVYLKLTDDVEGFLTGLQLLVKDVLIGPDKITIRHSMTGTATAARTAAR
jgi:site-specific DNA recombinase